MIIKTRKNARDVNMDILKQKLKNVSIVVQKNMEDPGVMNVDMKLIQMELKLRISFVKNVTVI